MVLGMGWSRVVRYLLLILVKIVIGIENSSMFSKVLVSEVIMVRLYWCLNEVNKKLRNSVGSIKESDVLIVG